MKKKTDFKTSELGLEPTHSIFINANQDEWSCGGSSDATDGAANAAQDLVPVVLLVKLIRESADGGLAARVVSAESWTFVFRS